MSDIIAFIKVIKAPNPVLRGETKPVKKITPGLLQTTKEMIKLTKTFKDPERVGLASTQIGLSERFFVAKIPNNTSTTHLAGEAKRSSSTHLRGEKTSEVKKDDKFIAVFNPQIILFGKRTRTYIEGCLSIPDYYGEVKRHILIKISFQNEMGQKVTRSLKGIDAWIFQHEMDHLEGMLFPDRVLQQKGKFYKCTGKDETGTDIFEEISLS